ncbi:MAG: bifunctional DNA primase/polymerase, partial [Thermodesulfovibrio sp.]|nr:bifunctional DNA primase/polymerase [Thermodesulfovibrio sp.]
MQIPRCSLLGVAKCYLRAGISIVPVKQNSKEPSISWKPYQNQYIDSDSIDKLFHESSNLAIVTGKISNLTIVDVDNIDKFNNFYNFNKLMAQAGVVVKSLKGWHLWFSYEPTLKTKQHQ